MGKHHAGKSSEGWMYLIELIKAVVGPIVTRWDRRKRVNEYTPYLSIIAVALCLGI